MELYKHINHNFLLDLENKAATALRKRSHLNLHSSFDEPVQKTIIALTKGTYIPPHYHRYEHQKELFVVLNGIVKILFFNEDGSVSDVLTLSNGEMADVLPFSIHTVVCVSGTAQVLEIKNGPFVAEDCKELPSWSIPEGVNRSCEYLKWLESAQVGSKIPDYLNDF